MNVTPEEFKFGIEEVAFIKREADAWFEANGGEDDFDNSDNFRLCRVGDVEGEDEYEDIKNNGCCGFVDIEIGPSPAGHTYRYGFNYGH